MLACFLATRPADSIPIIPVREQTYQAWLEGQESAMVRWLSNTGFVARPGNRCLIPGPDGTVAAVVIGIASTDNPWVCGDLSKNLAAATYHLVTDWEPAAIERATIGWGLGAYRFTRYKSNDAGVAKPCGHVQGCAGCNGIAAQGEFHDLQFRPV